MKTKAKEKKAPARKTASSAPRAKKRKVAAAPRRKKSARPAARSQTLGGKIEVPATLKWMLGIGGVIALTLGGVLMSGRSQPERPQAPVSVQTEVTAPFEAPPNAEPQVAEAQKTEQGWQPFLALLGAMAKPQGPSLGGRVEFWSELLLSSNAAREKLRELTTSENIQDIAPLVPEKFDCTTYVETVLSLARSQRPEEFASQLRQVRYRAGSATYRDRNHFPEGDWLPNNTEAGLIRDITAEVGQDAGVPRATVRKQLRPREWVESEVKRGRVDRSIASVDDQRWDSQEAEVTYLPMESVARYASKIPHGAIVNIVRKDMPKRPVLITHQGFVIQKDGKTLFRHANPGGQIRTEPLSTYLATASHRRAGGSILGLNINAIQEQ
jgi:hypothetical protein